MKKLLALALSMIMAFVVVGCGESAEDTKWIDEAAGKIEKEITSGQFVLDGVVYEFPMDAQYWLDNGWHISNNYTNIDEFTLEPGSSSTEFELFNESKDYVKITVLNTSNEDAKVKDCMVYSLRLKLSTVDVVFPQGITKRSKPAEIKNAYGEPKLEETENDYLTWTYTYETKEEWKCVVDIEAYDNKTTQDPCTEVTYYIMSFDVIWDTLIEEKGVEEALKMYMDATMKTSFTGDFTDYIEYCIDSKTGAEALYNSEVEYYSEFLRYCTDIEEKYVDDEAKARFNAIAKKVLSKVMWEVESVEEKNVIDYEMVLKIYPTNFLDVAYDDIVDAINQFNVKYENVDISAMSDEEYAKLEKEYIEAVLAAMEKNVEDAGTKDAVTMTYDVNVDGTILSEDAWIEIDDIIMDAVEEQ